MRHLFVLACASAALIAATPNLYLDPTCNHDVKITNAAEPKIAKADFKANVEANAVVTVNAHGTPIKVEIVKSSGSSAIDLATARAARESKYSPEMSRCKAKTGQYLFHVATGNP